jgi:PAS domain S-box-containing protein
MDEVALPTEEQETSAATHRSGRLILPISILGIVLIALGFLGVARQLRKWHAAASKLQKLNDHLQQKFKERTDQLEAVNRALSNEVAERKVAEASLQDQREFLRLVIDTDPNLIFVKNLDGEFILANRAMAEIYGMTPDGLIGRRDSDFNNREEVERFRRDDQEVIALTKAKFISEESVTDSRTGHVRWFQTHKVPLLTKHKAPTQLLGVSTDISERKLAEQELKSIQQQLLQAQKMEAVGQLAGGIAHDFNNLLMLISTHSELIKDHACDRQKVSDYADHIYEAVRNAASIAKRLLAFSRKQPQQLKILNLNVIVSEFCKVLPKFLGEDIELLVVPEAESGLVLADSGQLEQVIMNLVVNARDAIGGRGRLTIETREVELGDADARFHGAHIPPGQYVLLAVSDTGCGMDAQTQSRLFEPFFTTKQVGKGTGLGLATVYGIVKQHQGFVWVYSELGKGSTFKIYLPRTTGRLTPESPVPAPKSTTGRGETILLVEDDDPLREVVGEYLKSNGYNVLLAGDGLTATEIASEQKIPIDVLLTDIDMAGKKGPDVAKLVSVAHPKVKVIYMSGYTERALHVESGAEPGAVYLEKPLRLVTLAQKISEILSPQDQQEAKPPA